MIAVGRYDRAYRDDAEVAFLVEDAHQGRGIAQLLLEHLAEAARERGIDRFYAELLPQNARMASVFADAGYRVCKGIDDGVLHVEFPILPTDTSVGVMERREHRAESASMRRLLTAGAAGPARSGRHGCRAWSARCSRAGSGARSSRSAPTTPRSPASATASSIAAVPGRIDLAVVSVPTRELGGVVIDAAHKGAHAHGRADRHRLAGRGHPDGGQPGPGVRHPGARSRRPRPDQHRSDRSRSTRRRDRCPAPAGSGCSASRPRSAIGLLNYAVRHDIGMSSVISTGEYADITGNDVMQYWEDDDATRVCLLSLDSIGNPRKFSRIARRLARRKPVVVFDPGRTHRAAHLGVRGGLGHAPDEAVDALFRQSGVMVVHRRGAMFDIAKIAARQPLPTGPRGFG